MRGPEKQYEGRSVKPELSVFPGKLSQAANEKSRKLGDIAEETKRN